MKGWIKDGPPGWPIQWAITLSVLSFLWLAGLGVKRFFDLVTAAQGALVAIIPAAMAPWLAYKAYNKSSETKQ